MGSPVQNNRFIVDYSRVYARFETNPEPVNDRIKWGCSKNPGLAIRPFYKQPQIFLNKLEPG
jgi:hypothetical protein